MEQVQDLLLLRASQGAFRNKLSFGKRIEHYVIGLLLKEQFDVFLPVIDDDAIDVVVKRPDGKFIELQIKARSRNVRKGTSARFAAIIHSFRPDYWFVFYSEYLGRIWLLSSEEFLENSILDKSGKRTIQFNTSKDEVDPKYSEFIVDNFNRLNLEDKK